jgi:hypothetical protein
MPNRALHCERTWRRIGMQILALPPLRQGGIAVALGTTMHLAIRTRVTNMCARSLAACPHASRRQMAQRLTRGASDGTTHDAPCVHARMGRRVPVVSDSLTPRSTPDHGLSHHTLPVMSVLPCADLAAARLVALSEFSMSGYGNRVGMVVVTASGPGFSTG